MKTKRRAVSGRVADASAARAEKYEKVFEKIYRMVCRIPRGRVMTYGQIARLLEDRYSPRLVGWAMHATPQDKRNIPWHRVVNSKGGISTGRVIIQQPDLQRLLLEAEGVLFDERGHCDLSAYQWSPRRMTASASRASIKPAKKERKISDGNNRGTNKGNKRKVRD
jgi:methylated-DNA-protein-cysteine methyltransferase-like protein